MSAEAKPSGDESKQFTIRIKNQANDVVTFKIKKTTKMAKVFNAYAQQKGIQVKSLRFLKDGLCIAEDQTAKMAELEDDDEIDCLLEQEGGLI